MPSTHWDEVLDDDPLKAADQTYRRYQRAVYALARKWGLYHTDAEDLVQEVFMTKFLEKADPARGKFRSYITQVTRNMIAKFWEYELAGRRDRRKAKPLSDSVIAAKGYSDSEIDRVTPQLLIHAALDALPQDAETQALQLSLRGEKRSDIATRLGKSEAAVNSLITRAKLRIKKWIEQVVVGHGGSAEASIDIEWVREILQRNTRFEETLKDLGLS